GAEGVPLGDSGRHGDLSRAGANARGGVGVRSDDRVGRVIGSRHHASPYHATGRNLIPRPFPGREPDSVAFGSLFASTSATSFWKSARPRRAPSSAAFGSERMAPGLRVPPASVRVGPSPACF